ncbi:MAG TPA: flagellar basal body P-ring formation chaperone FlgA [Magnetovibrio sp.]
MNFITFVIAALMLLSTPAFAEEVEQAPAPKHDAFVTLMGSVTVTDGVVRLGDIFHGVDAYADKVVAYAPRPGGRAVFDSRWLARVASAYKLNWQPSSTVERVVIERASQIVTKTEVEDLLQQRLLDDGGDASSQALLSNRSFVLHLPIDAANNTPPTLDVQQLTVDDSTGRFSAVIAWGSGADDNVHVAGKVERMAQVPVLANRVMRGEVIKASDIQWQTLAEGRLPRTAITEVDLVVGMAAKRTLQAGKPIAIADIRRPLLVNKGESVTMYLTTPSMRLTAKGRALEHGSEGDTIRISNSQTNTVVDAIVTGPGQARVETSVDLAMR